MPSLNLAIARLVHAGSNHFAIWVVKAPYPSGHAHHDCVWTPTLSQVWLEWQQLFAGHSNLYISQTLSESEIAQAPPSQLPLDLVAPTAPTSGQPTNYAGRLMQYFGNSLWQWVFDGAIFE